MDPRALRKPPRDFQRSRVYKSEYRLHFETDQPIFKTLEECQFFLDQVLPVLVDFQVPKIKLNDGRGRRRAFYSPLFCEISLPRWARRPSVILHELAHAIPTDEPWHGVTFCSVYLMLVREVMGPDYAEILETEFIKNKVKF